MVKGIKDFEFQNDCVNFLIQKTVERDSKKVITVKAPTGAGKTIILIKYIDEYLNNTDNNTAFVWLCPGKGDLEEQSKEQMERITPQRDTRNLLYSLLTGFTPGSITFVNWELVTKRGNNALKDGERQNLFDRIADAHKEGTNFVVIIDEEHTNNTSKANDIINAFAAKNIIRVSATANKVSHQEYYEIPEDEVINAGLITRAIYVNEGVDEDKQIVNDYDYLLDLADEKRKVIAENYKLVGANIRPLVLIQFPAGQPETIKAVEEKLESIHNLIYPMRKTSEDIEYEAHNLWLIDERLAYCEYISSDIPFDNNPKEERTDILMLDHPIALSDENNTGREFETIVIFELKRPMRDDYDAKENPIQQLLGYVDKLCTNKVTDKNGRLIKVGSNTQFYLYAVCDLTQKMIKVAEDRDFIETPDKLGMYKYHEKKRAYIELISYDKLILDAEKRNKVLFEKLGI